jgi:nucleoside-diphosphate-sugar epimerase
MRQKIAIIGAGGYVGSSLYKKLKEWGHDVTGYDRQPRISTIDLIEMASHNIPTSTLQSFDAIIYLGGLTGRVACDSVSNLSVVSENVCDPFSLVQRMTPCQLFAFASTSAITEGSGEVLQNEDDHVREHMLDKYSLSMFERETAFSLFSETHGAAGPQLMGFRFGTVIGVSDGQRTDLLQMALVTQAYTTGKIAISHPETHRAMLWLQDLTRAVSTAVENREKVDVRRAKGDSRLSIFHLRSFNTEVGAAANAVAAATGASIHALDHSSPDVIGFSMSSEKFTRTFDFDFAGTQDVVIQDLLGSIPDSITPKGPHLSVPSPAEGCIPCPVCGTCHPQPVLDLRAQPFANDFRPSSEDALRAPRSPLKIVRCRVCNHMYLSHIANRQNLFSNYLYRSGTSSTLAEYFEWLATKVTEENDAKPGTVLEIACNDGSQLDKFKAKGWKTYGVDPAENLAPIAREKGHVVEVGYFGSQSFPSLRSLGSVDAIVAQNVFAHVPKPVEFLRNCAEIMGIHTKLYIQTSQCQMHQEGQFDTVYHEHISFFTGHSFQKAADLANLRITNFELTPIHGTSCLVTFQKFPAAVQAPGHGASLMKRLESEREDGIDQDFFYVKYRSRAWQIRSWLHQQLGGLSRSGYRIGAYGAAAKGMVLLHFMLGVQDRPWNVEFVVDDAPLKQNTFCPGTSIPVVPTAKLSDVITEKPLAIVVFAWNFWPEIKHKIRIAMSGSHHEVVCVLPFPSPHLVLLDEKRGERDLKKMPYHPQVWPVVRPAHPKRRRVMLISHFQNEEFFLPYWIQHHAPHFDHAVLIDFNSTDRSVDIIKRLAPLSWKVVPSRTGGAFDAEETDTQVMEWEKKHPDDWHLALTTTEFLVHRDLRSMLAALDPRKGESRIINFPAAHVIGDDSFPMKRFEAMVEQRSVYDRRIAGRGSQSAKGSGRFAHTGYGHTYRYESGRHDFFPAPPDTIDWPIPVSGFILKFSWSPWPDVKNRKMQIGAHLLESDSVAKVKRGWQYFRSMDPNKLEHVRVEELRKADPVDLRKVVICDDAHMSEECLRNCSYCATTCPCQLHEQYHDAVDPAQPLF